MRESVVRIHFLPDGWMDEWPSFIHLKLEEQRYLTYVRTCTALCEQSVLPYCVHFFNLFICACVHHAFLLTSF